MHGARLHKTSRRDAMARDPRRDLLLRDRDETLVRFETVSGPRRLDRDHISGKWAINYLRQGGNVFAGFCLSVCLFFLLAR